MTDGNITSDEVQLLFAKRDVPLGFSILLQRIAALERRVTLLERWEHAKAKPIEQPEVGRCVR